MEFINNYGRTRNGFYHTSKLYYNSGLLSEARANYSNRTWEGFPYQSVMKQAVRNAINNEIVKEKVRRGIIRLTKSLRDQIETESGLIQLLKGELKSL